MRIPCSVYGCYNRTQKKELTTKVHFHRFPMKRPDMLNKWIMAVRRMNWKPTINSYICSDHFSEGCYIFGKDRDRPLLKADAVPDIFDFPDNLCKRKRHKINQQLLQKKSRVANQLAMDRTALESAKAESDALQAEVKYEANDSAEENFPPLELQARETEFVHVKEEFTEFIDMGVPPAEVTTEGLDFAKIKIEAIESTPADSLEMEMKEERVDFLLKHEDVTDMSEAIPKPSKRRWKPDAMKQAVEKVLSGNLSFRQAAHFYQVPRSTLSDQVSAVKRGEEILNYMMPEATAIPSKERRNPDVMKQAVEKVLSGNLSFRQAADFYKVPKSVLSDRVSAAKQRGEILFKDVTCIMPKATPEPSKGSWNPDAMKQAVEKVLSGNLSFRQAADFYKVPKSTLSDRVTAAKRGKKIRLTPLLGHFKPTFSDNLEHVLVSHVKNLSDKLLPLTKKEFLKLAFQLAEASKVPHRFNREKRIAGNNFYYAFMKRHPDLSLQLSRINESH